MRLRARGLGIGTKRGSDSGASLRLSMNGWNSIVVHQPLDVRNVT